MNGKSEYGSGRPIAVRLTRGKDLRQELLDLCGRERILAGTIASLVGSLDVAALRFAGQDQVKILPGPFEIVSATGTCGREGCTSMSLWLMQPGSSSAGIWAEAVWLRPP